MKRIQTVSRQDLLSAPLPAKTKSYTVISHKFVIDTIHKNLSEKGFVIKNEIYRSAQGGDVGEGVFHIEYGNDPDLGMMFAFVNSYNKTIKFTCAAGAFVRSNSASILRQDSSSWKRKHTGNADTETEDTIVNLIDNASQYFQQLATDKEKMKTVTLNDKQFSELAGILYMDLEILTTEQLSFLKQEWETPSYTYTTPSDSLWTLYNHILVTLRKTHPKQWMSYQRIVHMYIMNEYDFTNYITPVNTDEDVLSDDTDAIQTSLQEVNDNQPDALPGQTNIIEQAEEVEEAGVNNVSEIQLPTAPADLPVAESNQTVEDTEETVEELVQQINNNPSTQKLKDAIDEIMDTESANIPQLLDDPGDSDELNASDDEDTSDDLIVEQEEVSPAVEDVNLDDEFFISKTDLDEIHPGLEIEVGMNLYIGDDACQVTSIKDDSYGLIMLGDVELVDRDGFDNTTVDGPEEVVDLDKEEDDDWDKLIATNAMVPVEIKTEEEVNHELHGVDNNPENVISEQTPEPEEDDDEVFEIDDPAESVDHKDMLNSSEPASEESVSVTPENFEMIMKKKEDQLMRPILEKELEDLYGEVPEFTFEVKDDQYNITLATGESFVLDKSYIDSLNV